VLCGATSAAAQLLTTAHIDE